MKRPGWRGSGGGRVEPGGRGVLGSGTKEGKSQARTNCFITASGFVQPASAPQHLAASPRKEVGLGHMLY